MTKNVKYVRSFNGRLKSLRSKKDQNGATVDVRGRDRYWKYCVSAFNGARERARNRGLPFEISARFLDELFVDQKWCCAISGIEFRPPYSGIGKHKRDPFSPSLDRIVPSLGYVPGNVRMVCNMVNLAMSEWGEESLQILFHAMARKLVEKKTTNIDDLLKQFTGLEAFK